jgi:hypothetical protein
MSLVKGKMLDGNMALLSMINEEKLNSTIAITSIPMVFLF